MRNELELTDTEIMELWTEALNGGAPVEEDKDWTETKCWAEVLLRTAGEE